MTLDLLICLGGIALCHQLFYRVLVTLMRMTLVLKSVTYHLSELRCAWNAKDQPSCFLSVCL